MWSYRRSLQALPRAAGMGDQEKLQKLVAHPAFVKLRSTCTEVEELKNARSKLEEDANLKARADDLQSKFLATLQRGACTRFTNTISCTSITVLRFSYEYIEYYIVDIETFNFIKVLFSMIAKLRSILNLLF